MITGGLDTAYRTAYNRPHRPVVRVEVWDGDELAATLNPIAGSVQCSLNSQVTRRGSMTLDPALTPRKPTDLLAPFGNRLRIYRGIAYGQREWLFPVFTGLITKASRKPRQPLTVDFSDRAVEVDENDFEAPEETLPGRTITDEIIRLISEGVPGAEFGTCDTVGVAATAQVFDDSRAQACDTLAETAGCFWYALADGRFVIRRVPWAWHPDPDNIDPVWTYAEMPGEFPNARFGTITDYGMSMTRETVYNSVVGVADQPDGTQPSRAVARDTDLNSPTYIGGKFGRRVLKADLPSAATSAIVHTGAESLLRRSRASAEATPWSMMTDASLELGDMVRLDIDDRHLLRVISEFDVPLTEDGEMSCTGRPLVLPTGRVVDEVYGVFTETSGVF